MHNEIAQKDGDHATTGTRRGVFNVCADPDYKINSELMAALDLGLFEALCAARTPPNRICRDLDISHRDFDHLLENYQM